MHPSLLSSVGWFPWVHRVRRVRHFWSRVLVLVLPQPPLVLQVWFHAAIIMRWRKSASAVAAAAAVGEWRMQHIALLTFWGSSNRRQPMRAPPPQAYHTRGYPGLPPASWRGDFHSSATLMLAPSARGNYMDSAPNRSLPQ